MTRVSTLGSEVQLISFPLINRILMPHCRYHEEVKNETSLFQHNWFRLVRGATPIRLNSSQRGWGERKAEMKTDGAPFYSFSAGTWKNHSIGCLYKMSTNNDITTGVYACPEKNFGIITLRSSLSRMAQEFNVALAPGETGENFDKEALDTLSTTLPPLMVQVTARN